MPVASELLVRIQADTADAEKGIDRVDKQISGFAKGASALGGVATAAFAGIGVAAIGLGAGLGSAVGTAAEFEHEIAGVASLLGGDMLANTTALSDAALQLGQDITLSGIGASDAARAMQELAAAGFTVGEITSGAARGVLLLASATGTDVARAAEIAGDAFGEFRRSMGLVATDMPMIANLFVGAANVSSVSLEDIGASMKTVGPVAASMGISIQEVTAAIAALGNQGIKGSEAGTALRGILASLADPSKESAKLIRELGLNFRDSAGNMKDFGGISEELRTKMMGLTAAEREHAIVQLFGRENLAAILALMSEGEQGIADYTKKIQEQGNAAAQGAARNNNLAGSWQALQGVGETAAIKIGQLLTPMLKQWVDAATVAAQAAIPLIDAWGPRLIAGIQSGIGRAVAIVQSFGLAVMAMVNSLRTGDFSNLFGPLIVAISAAFGSETAGKVTLFVSKLVTGLNLARDAVITAKQAFAGDWVSADSIATPVRIIGDIFLKLGDAVRVVQGLFAQVPGPVAAVAAAFVALGPALSIAAAILPTLIGAFTGLGPIISFLTSSIPLLGTVVAALGGPLTLLIAAVAALAVAWATDFMGIQTATMPVIAAIGDAITGQLLPALQQIGTFLTATVVPAFVQGWAMIQQGVSTALTAITPSVQAFVGFLQGSLIPGIQGIIAVAGPAFDQMKTAAVGAFQAALPGIQAFIAGMQQLGTAALPILLSVRQAIQDDLGPAVMAMVGWAQTVIPQVAAAFTNVMSIVGPVVGALASLIGSALGVIAGFVEAHSAQITTALTAAWDIISATIGAVFAIITGIISAGLQVIAGDWSGAWQTVQQTASTVWDSIKTIVSSALDIIQAALSVWADLAKTVMATAWEAIKTAAQTAWDGIKTLVSNAIEGVKTAISDGMNAAKQTAQTALDAMATAATTAMDNLKTAISNGIQSAKDTITNGVAGFAAIVLGVGDAMYSAGASIIGRLAAGIDSAIGAAVDKVKAGLNQIANLLPHSEPKDPQSPLRGLTLAGRTIFEMFGAGINQGAPAAVKAAAEAASAVAKAITDGLSALTALSGFQGGPASSQMSGFLDSLADFMERFTTRFSDWEEDVLKGAQTFASAASAAVGVIKGGVEGLQLLDTFVAPLEASVSYFLRSLGDFLEKFTTAAGAWEEDVLASASVFATAVRDAVGVLSGAVSGLMALADFKAPLESIVSVFLASLGDFMEKFATAAGYWETDVLASASQFAAAARDAVGVLSGAVAGLASLEDFSAPIEATVSAFLAALGDFMERFATAAGAWEADVLASATRFAEGAGKVLAVVGPAIDGFSKFKDLVVPSQEAIDALVYGIFEMVRKIGEMASQMATEGIEQAGAFGAAAGSVFNAAKTAIDVFLGFKNLVIPSAKAIDDFAIGIQYVVIKIGSLADQIGKDGIERATKFGQSIQAIFGSLKSSMDILGNLKKFKDAAEEGFDSLQKGLIAAMDVAQGMVNQAKDLVLLAEEYANNMRKAASLFASGSSLGGVRPEDAGRTLGEGVISGAREAVGAHSPAEELAKLGRDITAGLVMGMEQTQQDAIKAAADLASSVAKAIQDTLSASQALGKLDVATLPGAGQIAGVLAFTRALVAEMAASATMLSEDGAKQTSAFADAAGKVASAISGTLGALGGLVGFVPPVAARIYDFGKTLRLAVNDLTVLAAEIPLELAEGAALFAEQSAKAIAVYGTGADAFGKLRDYARVGSDSIYAFGKDLMLAIGDLALMLDTVTIELATQAGAFGEQVGKATGGIVNAVAGLAAIRDYVRVPIDALYGFGKDLMLLMNDFAVIAEKVGAETIASSGALGEALGKAFGSISTVVQGFKDLANFQSVSDSVLDAFSLGVQSMIARMAQIAATVATQGVDAAALLGEALSKVFDGLNAATGFFKSLDNILLPDEAGIDRILAPILSTVSKVAALGRSLDPATLAAALAGADAIGKVTGAVQSGNQALVPAMAGGGGGRGGNTYVFNFNAPVADRAQVHDWVVAAIEEAERRGRV